MATTDANGQVFYGPTDPIEPIQSLFNGISTAVSSRLGSDVQIRRVANVAGRTAAVASRSSRPISVSDPLIVWREDAPEMARMEYTTNGTTWYVYGDNRRNPYIICGGGDIAMTGVTGTFTVNIPSVPSQITVWPYFFIGGASANYGSTFVPSVQNRNTVLVRYVGGQDGITVPYQWNAMYVQAGV